MIELASVIRDLREELQRAAGAAEGESLRFELGPIELEMSVALERSAKGGAKVRFLVVESGAEAAVAATRTQRITLTLQPTLTEPGGSNGSGGSGGSGNPPYVSGIAEEHER